MKILFLVKFYQPFDRGGSEWSTHDLAMLLSQKKHDVTIVTPNYGSRSRQTIGRVNIIRMPFPKKISDPKQTITPWWTNNIFWIIISCFFCLKYTLKEKIDVIHVHSNEFLPAAVITSTILRKPTVATFRDYQAICSLGFCLWNKNKRCSFKEFINSDLAFFLENYVSSKNQITRFILTIAAIRSRIYQKIIFYFAQRINYKVAVSEKVLEIFEANGIKGLRVINNPVLVKNSKQRKKLNNIIYIGKLSKGKGVDLLVDSLPYVFTKLPKVKLQIIGSGHLEDLLKEKSKTSYIDNKIRFKGQMSHNSVLEKIGESSLVIVPSIWPEPLPRTILESILLKTPVVATNVGGNKEIIKNNIYGLICKPQKQELAETIVQAYNQKEKFIKNITKDVKMLRKRFSSDVLRSYYLIYSEASG